MTDLRSHLSRLSLNTFLEQTRSALVNSECAPRSPHQPGVEDGEEQGPPLLLRHHRAGDVEVGELGEAGTEDVGVHPGEAHRVKGE